MYKRQGDEYIRHQMSVISTYNGGLRFDWVKSSNKGWQGGARWKRHLGPIITDELINIYKHFDILDSMNWVYKEYQNGTEVGHILWNALCHFDEAGWCDRREGSIQKYIQCIEIALLFREYRTGKKKKLKSIQEEKSKIKELFQYGLSHWGGQKVNAEHRYFKKLGTIEDNDSFIMVLAEKLNEFLDIRNTDMHDGFETKEIENNELDCCFLIAWNILRYVVIIAHNEGFEERSDAQGWWVDGKYKKLGKLKVEPCYEVYVSVQGLPTLYYEEVLRKYGKIRRIGFSSSKAKEYVDSNASILIYENQIQEQKTTFEKIVSMIANDLENLDEFNRFKGVKIKVKYKCVSKYKHAYITLTIIDDTSKQTKEKTLTKKIENKNPIYGGR